MPGTRVEQREQTRRKLVAESRRLFAARGYADVGLAEIVRAAGVTKGALYHLFDGKTDLFRTVLAQVQQEVATTVAAEADARADPWDQLTAGCRAFLRASTDPSIARIMLIDGPAVLGWSEWRALDEATSGQHLAEALAALTAAGVLGRRPVEPVTRLLSGAMNEAALWLAVTDAPGALDEVSDGLSRMLEALRARE